MRRKDPGAQPPGAYDTALGLLSRREHSRRDLERKLARRGVAKDDADAALERLERDHYQSDDRFADALVRRRAAAGYGPRHILAELATHGIGAATARPLLDAQDWAAIACDLALRRARTGGDGETARRRLVALLQRRGFAGDHIRRALGAAAAAVPEAD